MSGGTSTNACGGNTGVKVGNISGHAHIKYAKGAVNTGSIHCGQGAQSTGGHGGLSVTPVPLQNLQVNSVIDNDSLQQLGPLVLWDKGLDVTTIINLQQLCNNGPITVNGSHDYTVVTELQQLGRGPVTIDNNGLMNLPFLY